jgi:hypothetical protein
MSLPVDSKENASSLLGDIFIGIADLCDENSLVVLYSNEQLNNTKISEGFTFYDYKENLLKSNNRDLAEFVFKIEERSPFLDFISESKISDIMKYDISLFEIPIVSSECDILKYACLCFLPWMKKINYMYQT